MLIMSLCDNPDFLRVMKLVRTVLMLIRIVVPIILIITLMVSFMKAILDKDNDAIHKELKNAVSKMIAAILVFLIPTFISLIFSAVGNSKSTYAACFDNATEAKIEAAYIAKAQKYLKEANDSEERRDYFNVSKAIANIKDDESRKELQNQAEELLERIEKKEEAEIRARNLYMNGAYIWPVNAQSSITACFGAHDEVHNGHSAIDIAGVPANTQIHAIASGTVTYASPNGGRYKDNWLSSSQINAGSCGGCGNYVVVDHGNGIKSWYCHMSQGTVIVKNGDIVNQGDVLGMVGTSGCSTGRHLHLAITQNGSNVDPLNYVIMKDVTNPNKCN